MTGSSAGDEARRLEAVVDALPQPLFAVLDGAHFDDLEDELDDAGIRSRSLFLRGGDEAMRRDGPWLVALDNRRERSHVIALAVEKPCAVFWSCPDGEDALWRHLRTINEVLIPDERAPARRVPDEAVKYERVLFRHWDPNVMAQVLPELTETQFCRFFGPAVQICFRPTDQWGSSPKRAFRPESKISHLGPLRLEVSSINAIEEKRLEYSRAKVMAYLREVDPYTEGISDAEIARRIRIYETSGNAFGLESERAHMKWAYLMSISEDQIKDSPETQRFSEIHQSIRMRGSTTLWTWQPKHGASQKAGPDVEGFA